MMHLQLHNSCETERCSNGKQESKLKIYVIFLVAPSLITTPAGQTVIEGAKATFHCNATGNPAPKITWIKDGKTVAEGETLSFETHRNQTGKYWCSAENGLNSTINSSAMLDVLCMYKMKLFFLMCLLLCKEKTFLDLIIIILLLVISIVPPSLSAKPSNKTIMESEQVIFHCAATGNPLPNITWIKDGKTVAKGDTLSFKANRIHSGKYWCLAENGLDITVNTSAVLDVECKCKLILCSTVSSFLTDPFITSSINVYFPQTDTCPFHLSSKSFNFIFKA